MVQLAFADLEALTAPDDGVSGKASDPKAGRNHIADREQPEIRKNLVIAKHPGANCHGKREPQKEAESEKPQAERAEATCDDVQQRQGEAVRKEEARVPAGPRVAHRAQPAQLMIAESAPAIGGNAGLDHLRAEHNAIAGFVDALAEFVIVGKMIDENFKAADLLEGFAAYGERGAEAIAQAAFDQTRNKNTADKVGSNAERLKPRGKCLVCAAAIKRCDEAGG